MIVITGAGGFIGSYVAEHLKRKRILPLKRENFDITNSVYWRDPALIPQTNVEYLVHCAGALMIDRHTSKEYMMANAVGTVHAAEYCIRTGAKLIYLQTHSDVNASGNLYIGEETPRAFVPSLGNGSAAFVASKIAAVEVIQAYNRAKLLHGVILRLANVRGHGSQDTKHKTNFHMMIQKAEKGEDIELWGALTTVRDLIYVKDVANAVLKAIENNALPGLYNIGSGVGLTWEQEVKAIVRVFTRRKQSTLIYCPDKEEVRKQSCIFDIGKAKDFFNWSPLYSYERGLADIKKIRDDEALTRRG